MNRGLRASLSPNEERSLRHVAAGTAPAAPGSDIGIRQLVRLGLVEETADGLRLTATGRQRYLDLAGATGRGDAA